LAIEDKEERSMIGLTITTHAVMRMAQRSIRLHDADLIALVGTQVDDGYLVREKDCQAAEHVFKMVARRIRRLRGKRLVVADGRIVTAFHASRRQQRSLLRNAQDVDLKIG
jgi:hypothetical protein